MITREEYDQLMERLDEDIRFREEQIRNLQDVRFILQLNLSCAVFVLILMLCTLWRLVR